MSDVIIPQTWFGNNRLIPVRGEDGRIFLLTPLVPEGEEIVLEIVPLSQIRVLESNRDQVSKALCGKENATNEELLQTVDQLKSRIAQVERERDAAVNDLPHNCWNCIYHRDTPIEEIDTGGRTIHRYCDADYCYPEEENSSWKWRGVCPENTKEE